MTERWPYTEPHIQYTRYGVRMASGAFLKGLSRADAEDVASDDAANVVVRSVITYVTGGPDKGYEVLGPWKVIG